MKAFQIITEKNSYIVFACSTDQAKVWLKSFGPNMGEEIISCTEVNYNCIYSLKGISNFCLEVDENGIITHQIDCV